MIDCPVLNYKVVNCFGCRFFKKWGNNEPKKCWFEQYHKKTAALKTARK